MYLPGAALSSLGLGTGLMYFLNPRRGGRRALMRDRAVHNAKRRQFVRTETPDDRQLVERVRARLGRVVSHAHAIDVDACDGCVTLSGPILHSEASRAIAAVQAVPGVQLIVNELGVRRRPEHVPSLQGGRTRPGLAPGIRQRSWARAARCAVGTSGLGLMLAGARRGGATGAALVATGVLLALRGATNLEVKRFTGIGAGRRAVDVQKTITIDAPIEDVFAFWSDYENFPRFLSRVLNVRPAQAEGVSHWIVKGPAGRPVDFETELSAYEPNRLLGWRTLESSRIRHAGLVQLEPAPDGGTRVTVRMSYNPPGDWIGHEGAPAFGVDAKRSLDEDLLRMETLLDQRSP